MISLDDAAMAVPDEDLPSVAPRPRTKVVEEAKDAGVWVFGGGLESRRATSRPPTGRSPTARGFAIVDVSSHEEALEWAAKIALACRCAQEVRELLPDPTV